MPLSRSRTPAMHRRKPPIHNSHSTQHRFTHKTPLNFLPGHGRPMRNRSRIDTFGQTYRPIANPLPAVAPQGPDRPAGRAQRRTRTDSHYKRTDSRLAPTLKRPPTHPPPARVRTCQACRICYLLRDSVVSWQSPVFRGGIAFAVCRLTTGN